MTARLISNSSKQIADSSMICSNGTVNNINQKDFKIITKPNQLGYFCNICGKEFKNNTLQQDNRKQHEQSFQHQKTMKAIQQSTNIFHKTKSLMNVYYPDRKRYLVNGYSRENYTTCVYPKSLNDMIADFIGCISLKFDTYFDGNRHFLLDNGTRFRRDFLLENQISKFKIEFEKKPHTLYTRINPITGAIGRTRIKDDVYWSKILGRKIMVSCSWGWSTGINEFKIRIIKPNKDTIGIIEDVNECCRGLSHWIKQSQVRVYMLHSEGELSIGCNQEDTFIMDCGNRCLWKVNDVIKVVLNCYQWKVYFFVNDKIVGYIKVAANKTYFPVLGSGYDKTEYQFID